ncbi:MAG: rhodanese-like domain-containing protein [Synechococcaceae cyanobacterium SM1_2_3]|nr:rhodanese-like domain-containing protein [Synechococcaceae cyanobacterium SM1_2_3]
MSDFAEFALLNWLLFAALFAIAGMLIGGEVLRKVRGVSVLEPNDVLRLMNDRDAVIVDVSDLAEYKNGHIAQARHIPFNALPERLAELTKIKDKPIVLYCRTGTTSQSACALLRKNGFAEVHSLNGGLAAWLDAKLPISRKKS